ncbi:J domain-containing protein [uncultured Legionella sp.]|uniref:J domain-containing protein n=1 Tax=uncultured Legionella sp. TaxID=210934 RepID=UPI002610B9A3|nr:J domain-containing protein [uncultured Legionella sp.]
MTIEMELTKLADFYATFDKEKNCYVSQLDHQALLRLDVDHAKVLNQLLLSGGPEKEQIKKKYHLISVKVHPDRMPNWCHAVRWIEGNLSQGKNDGACFKALNLCYEKFIYPEKFKDNLKFADIKTNEDCKKWLANLKEQAGTYTAKSLYESLGDLLDQSSGFFDESGKIKPMGLRVLIKSLPMIFATYGTFIFAEELFAIYALYFIVLKGGQYLERNESAELRRIGKTLQEISTITATATTTLIVRLLEMTFWASRQCLDVSLQIGASIFTPLLSAPSVYPEYDFETAETLCRDLVIASTNLNEGMQFKTPELKFISAPLESYLGLNSQQLFLSWRLGKYKNIAVEKFLFRMRVLDSSLVPVEQKLIEAKAELEKIKSDTDVYNGNTEIAINRAEHVISLLQTSEPSSMQLIAYSPK